MRSWTIAVLALVGCSDDSRASTEAEILERLARIENRISALERRDRGTSEPQAPESPTADPFAALGEADDPMQVAPARRAPSLALSVTREGWRIDDKPVDAAQLRILLEGVGSVTVNASIDAPHDSLVDLLDLLKQAEITRVAIARPSLDRGWSDSE